MEIMEPNRAAQKMDFGANERYERKIDNNWRLFSCPAITTSRCHSNIALPIKVNVQLNNRKLWRKFHAQTTEMIITKLGRRMFPAIQVSITGLEPNVKYHVLLEISPTSQRRHKYVGSLDEAKGKCQGWTIAGSADEQSPIHKRLYVHPDSPATGSHWSKQPVSFSKLKLTNNAVDSHNNIVLTSMHKYIPKIWIIQSDHLGSMNSIYHQASACFVFDETEFIAVTAYQNENITKLKIDNNPFAKGFRETGHYRCKRKFEDSYDNPTEEDLRSPVENPEKVERIEIDHENGEDASINPPVRLHRPWVESHVPKVPEPSSLLHPSFSQIFNFSTFFPFDPYFSHPNASYYRPMSELQTDHFQIAPQFRR